VVLTKKVAVVHEPLGEGHGGLLNTATTHKKIKEHRITARKVNETPSPQHVFLAP